MDAKFSGIKRIPVKKRRLLQRLNQPLPALSKAQAFQKEFIVSKASKMPTNGRLRCLSEEAKSLLNAK